MTRNPVTAATDISVRTTGPVARTDVEYAREKVAKVLEFAPSPVLAARLTITQHADPAMARPAHLKASLDVNGHVVCARTWVRRA